MSTDAALRLVDLLAQQELGMRLLTDADPQVSVHGAHSIEVETPSRWLKPEWLMLTTGTRFSGHASSDEAQRELIRELSGAGIAGLGFGVGVCVQRVPPALVEEANKRGFPVVSIPFEIPFLQVIDAVNEVTVTRDVRLLKRTVGIQDYLLESLASPRADAALIQRLSELLRSTVVLYDESGSIVASAGVGPTQIIRAEIRGQSGDRKRFTVGRWHVLTDPINADGMTYWLAVASRRRAVSEELAEPAMEAARRLVSMIVRSREAVRAEDRLRRAELLRLLLDGSHADSHYVRDRLEMHGFRRQEDLRLVVVHDSQWRSVGDGSHDDTERLQRTAHVERAAHEAGIRLLVAGHGEHVVGVVAADTDGVEAWLQRMRPTVHCGISEPFQELSLAAVRVREAELALDSAIRGGRTFLRFDEVGLVDWLVAGRDPGQVERKARDMLEPLNDNAALIDALREYFRCGCDIQRTARALALHPNSVRYRLKRLERLLDRDLGSPADIAELHLSLRVLPGSYSIGVRA